MEARRHQRGSLQDPQSKLIQALQGTPVESTLSRLRQQTFRSDWDKHLCPLLLSVPLQLSIVLRRRLLLTQQLLLPQPGNSRSPVKTHLPSSHPMLFLQHRSMRSHPMGQGGMTDWWMFFLAKTKHYPRTVLLLYANTADLSMGKPRRVSRPWRILVDGVVVVVIP